MSKTPATAGVLLANVESRVGCDETFELDNTLGTGRSAAAIAEKGWHRVYLDFLLKVQSLCLSRHQRLGVALRPYDEHDGEYR